MTYIRVPKKAYRQKLHDKRYIKCAKSDKKIRQISINEHHETKVMLIRYRNSNLVFQTRTIRSTLNPS